MKSTLKDGGGKNLLFESTIFTGIWYTTYGNPPTTFNTALLTTTVILATWIDILHGLSYMKWIHPWCGILKILPMKWMVVYHSFVDFWCILM